MTAPAEDPRGGEVPLSPLVWDGQHRYGEASVSPAAGRGDTDSGGEPPCGYGHTKADHDALGACARPSLDAREAAHAAYPDPVRAAVRIAFERGWDAALAARPAGDRAQPTEEPSSNDVAVEDVRAIAVALGLGGHARPYSAHEVVQREILPAVVALLDAQAAVERVEALADTLAEIASSIENNVRYSEPSQFKANELGKAMGYRRSARDLRRTLGTTT